jgi:hypothetical protein
MKRNATKISLGIAVIIASISPAFANITNITINAELEEIASLQIESVNCGNVVSVDNVDASSTLQQNEILNFGLVNPLGLETGTNGAAHAVSRPETGINCTTFTLESMVIDTNYLLHNPVEDASHPLPKGSTNLGALYFTRGAVQLRSLRTEALDMNVDVYNEGDFDALVAISGGSFGQNSSFQPGTKIADRGPDTVVADLPYTTTGLTLENDKPQPIDLGIVVPYTMSLNSPNKTTVITFKGQ